MANQEPIKLKQAGEPEPVSLGDAAAKIMAKLQEKLAESRRNSITDINNS